ncbi:MAG: hypothetical protein IKH82_03830 [Clostridiales bacterium]|nr:hypothetical protein [Clostridiales bacterium]
MLINKEKLINKIATEVHYDTEHPLESYAKLLMMIVEAEEEEAEPIRHGKWIINECLGVKDMLCPECGEMYDYNEGLEEDWKYCPNCGAKMDEVMDEVKDEVN